MATEKDFVSVARKLGAKRDEIVSLEQTPEGLVIVTKDGKSVIDVPADKPDGEGKTGLMLLRRPNDLTTDLPVPIFVPLEDLPAGDAPTPAPKKGTRRAAQ